MVLSVGLGTGYTYAVKLKSNWIPLIDIEDLITPQTLVNLIGRLDKLEYNIIVSDKKEIRNLMNERNIAFTRVVKNNKNNPAIIDSDSTFILKKDMFLLDFLENTSIKESFKHLLK